MPWDNNRPTHVPTRLRQACLDRDGHQCVAITRDGNRCPETTNLEADHIAQWEAGEHTSLDNLQTLCWWHHNRKTQAEALAAKRRKGIITERRPSERHPGLT